MRPKVLRGHMLAGVSRCASRAADRLCQAAATSAQVTRNTWVLQRVHAVPVTPEGQPQRDPSELKELQRYEVVDFEAKHAAGPIKIILLEDVEGIGHQFDVVEVDRKRARTDLLLSRKAVYASPYDLEYYADMKEKMKDELAARIRIPFELITVGRQLQAMVVPLKVNMENKWELNRAVIKASLRQMGVVVADEGAIRLTAATSEIQGPNFDLEAKLVRFYVVVSKQYVVPMLGRISHISADETKQVLGPDTMKIPTAADLSKHGLKVEQPYFHTSADIDSEFDVIHFMTRRILN